jgi:hypothetical protein
MGDPLIRIISAAALTLLVILFALWGAPDSFFSTPTQTAQEPSHRPSVYTGSVRR